MMLLGGIFYKTIGAGILFSCYFGMVMLALSSSSERALVTSTLPSSTLSTPSSQLAATRSSHAYLTTMTEASSLPSLITLSRSLLTVQSPYRLVVLLPSSFAHHHQPLTRIIAALPNVKVEFVKPITLPSALLVDPTQSSSFLLLSAFALTQYRRLLHLPLQSWLTRNIDRVLLSHMPLAFSIGVASSYTPLMCATADSINELLTLESLQHLDTAPRHFLHPPGSLPFTSAPLLLAPSKAATKQLYALLEQRDTSYHGADCHCDSVTDVLSEWHHHHCTKQEVERQRQADEQHSAAHGGARSGLDHLTHAFYPHDYCTQRLPLNLSLPIHTHHCMALPAFLRATPLMSLQQCEQQYGLLPSLLPAPPAEHLAHVQQLSLAHNTPTPHHSTTSTDALFDPSLYTAAAETERESEEAESRKYGLIYLHEQRATAVDILQRVVDERAKEHGGTSRTAGGGGGGGSRVVEELRLCEAVYDAWLERYFDALSHLRPVAALTG